MKKCPYCAEEVQDEAIKCKHCGESLLGAGSGSALSPQGSPILQVAGAILLVLGVAAVVYYYFFFDTSVAVPSVSLFGQSYGGGSVNNLGLMQDKQNGLILGALGALAGLGLLLYGEYGGSRKK